MYSKAIKMGLEKLDNLIHKHGVPKQVVLVDSQANREFVSVASAMEKYKGIQFEINNSETAQLAANMRKFGETLNSNVEINF